MKVKASQKLGEKLWWMDTVACINRLRAQFLWECPENEQARRIIKPYVPQLGIGSGIIGSRDDDIQSEVARIYTAPDGHDMLPEMESPPLSVAHMDGYLSKGRPSGGKGRQLPRSEDESQIAVAEESGIHTGYGDDHVETRTDRNSAFENGQPNLVEYGTVTRRLSPVSSVSDSTFRKHESHSFTGGESAELEDSKKKGSRKLPFSRIFKGRHESSNSHAKKESKKRIDLHRKKRDLNFDIKFEYDEDLEEDDDEEEDEDGENLPSQFFQLDLDSNKSAHANGDRENDVPSNRDNGSSSNGNSNNFIPGASVILSNNNRKSYFPQNIMPRASLLDGGKNLGLRSDRSHKRANGHENEHIEGEVIPQNEGYGSDIESYIKEQDLDNLDLDADLSINDGRGFSKSDNESNSDCDSRSASSYGRSLLDSDFSGDEFMKDNSSAVESTSLLDDSDMQMDTVSHSIPMTVEEYGIYHGQDDSTLNNVFDEAVINMKKSSKPQLRERRSSNYFNAHSLSSTRHSSTSNAGARGKGHARSLSAASSDSSKIKSDIDKKCVANGDTRPSKLTLPSSIYQNGSKSSSLVIQKVTDYQIPDTSDSLLSTLFSRRKQNIANTADILEYFSFVSGNKVPRGEASTINVYIQSSEKYKREPFKANIRNSATIFEAIGYILYLFSTQFKPDDFESDGLNEEELKNPNNFCLKIVDEDGEPFEDDFGKLDRGKTIQSLSDNEVVLCKVSVEDQKLNEKGTPLPYDLHGEIRENVRLNDDAKSGLNQLSYYKPILGNESRKKNDNSKTIVVKVYLFPCMNKKFNYTSVEVSVTSSLNDILVRYCKMKKLDPNEYLLKTPDKKIALNLNDTVLRLDGQHEVEVVSKREARELHLEKSNPDLRKPNLPTIQSTDLTPLTLDRGSAYLAPSAPTKAAITPVENKPVGKYKKLGAKHKLMLSTQLSGSSNTSGNTVNAFFKGKNSSKASLHGSYYAPDHSTPLSDTTNTGSSSNNYQDLLSGAYHKYKVWRRQQMSLMNKHERALALDGDYIYIVPPEKHLHWHENVKTKSIHISQVYFVGKSKRVPEYFKLFIRRGQQDLKRYYFEAVSSQECTEIVSRIQNSLSAYKMNHK